MNAKQVVLIVYKSSRTCRKQDASERFIDVVRYFMAGWHIRPKVHIMSLFFKHMPTYYLYWLGKRESRSHSIQYWARYSDANGGLNLIRLDSICVSKCRTIHQSRLISTRIPTTAFRLQANSDQRQSSLATLPPQWWKAHLSFSLITFLEKCMWYPGRMYMSEASCLERLIWSWVILRLFDAPNLTWYALLISNPRFF